MSPIRVRNATGTERSFASREEFGRAVQSGQIASDWEVFHVRGDRWLPVSAHPAWPSVITPQAAATSTGKRRTSDLILIYPDPAPSVDPVLPPATEVDPFDAGPILAADEIHRILHAPRISGPALRVSDPAIRVADSQSRPLLEKALPTFSRAFQAAAELVQTTIS